MSEVIFKNVSKVYGQDVVAVKSLNLDIKDKEFISLLGPSGCGKSSTLRMVAGLEEITEGQLIIDGQVINHMEPGERDIAMVFENYALFPHMSAYDNVAFPLKIKGVKKEEIRKKIENIAAVLDMGKFLHDKAGSLGGGQKQRVGIARALIKDSSVLLMDEPISHLDADLRVRTRGELVRLQKLMGITTIYVTHDQIEALAMADRIAVMDFGELQQYGTSDELYNHPANIFVANFVGEPPMNFLPCYMTKNSQGINLKSEVLDINIDSSFLSRLNPNGTNGEVLLGFRPEDFLIKPSDEENIVKGKVLNYFPGCETSTAEIEAGVNRLLLQMSTDLLLTEGDNVGLDITFKKFHLFDCSSGLSIINQYSD